MKKIFLTCFVCFFLGTSVAVCEQIKIGNFFVDFPCTPEKSVHPDGQIDHYKCLKEYTYSPYAISFRMDLENEDSHKTEIAQKTYLENKYEKNLKETKESETWSLISYEQRWDVLKNGIPVLEFTFYMRDQSGQKYCGRWKMFYYERKIYTLGVFFTADVPYDIVAIEDLENFLNP